MLARSSRRAASPISRAIGLMFRASLPEGEGLVIEPCNGVVSFFMRFAIDVVFVDRRGAVCHLLRGLRPWRASKIVRRSNYVVELPAGTIDATHTELDDRIEVSPA